jgi:hypothetical protein
VEKKVNKCEVAGLNMSPRKGDMGARRQVG